MALTKLPCILIVTVGLHRSFIPPNVAARNEVVLRRGVVGRVIYGTTKPFDVVTWAVGLAEAVSIIAQRFPSWPLSKNIIFTLPVGRISQDLELTPLSVVGLLLVVSGAFLREYCYYTLGHFFTFEVSIRKGHRLITTGPYRSVRHPGYTGMVLLYFGTLFWCSARGSWIRESGVLGTNFGKGVFGFMGIIFTVLVFRLMVRMRSEDAVLKKAFGPEWDEWARRVPYLIVPGVY
ncbi:hypothetical protein BDZ94DRAFT_1253007 [Collybia nuda]|uniref:Protein-S-isoprenylcysteine O-methyltransferase n=1 Tax=Collybia nuda TaxID=64659 RepID=A0A9P5YD82_9AGAR|nr:hypothetical protein BDZ94DRAFT_1253007 [Collybia nuda]